MTTQTIQNTDGAAFDLSVRLREGKGVVVRMKLKSLLRVCVVACILTLLIAFPRGQAPIPGANHVSQAPIVGFSWHQFVENIASFLSPFAHLSLGTTYDGNPVMVEIRDHFYDSLGLLFISLAIVVVGGVSKGVYDGLNRNKQTVGPKLSMALQGVVESVPDFFIINTLVLLSYFLIRSGIKIFFVGSHEFVTGTLIPALIMAAVPTMYMARMVRMNVEEQLGQQYLVTADAKGILPRRIVVHHLLPNCFSTILNTLVPALGMLFSNLVIVEYLLFKQGIVSGLVEAMGLVGSQPLYQPDDLMVTRISYYAFDAHLVFGYILTCVLFILVCWVIVRLFLALLGYKRVTNPFTSTLWDDTSRRSGLWYVSIGAVMFLVIFTVGLLRGHLHLPDPEYQDLLHFGADGTMSSPPFPPFSAHHILGTDSNGRDLLSRSIYGVLPTFGYAALVVCLTLVVSTILAVLSSVVRLKSIRFVIEVWNSLFGVIPGVIAAFMILNIPDLYWFGVEVNLKGAFWGIQHILLYVSILAVTEIGRVAAAIQHVLDESCHKSYMEAAEIAGNTTWTAFWIHHFAPLRNTVLEQATALFSRVLLMLATLGFLYQPVNQAWLARGDFLEYSITSMDWSSLIAQNARDFYSYNWILFPPVLLITYTVVSMNLIRAGLLRLAQSAPPVSRKRSNSVLWRMSMTRRFGRVSQDV